MPGNLLHITGASSRVKLSSPDYKLDAHRTRAIFRGNVESLLLKTRPLLPTDIYFTNVEAYDDK